MNLTAAFLDILGFRSLIDSEPIEVFGPRVERIIGEVLPAMKRNLSEFQGEPSLLPEIRVGEDLCFVQTFSDSIILVARDESENGCLALLVYALRVAQVLIASGLPIRGGIAHHKLYVSRTRSVVLGKALTNAYDLEQRQNWIGIAIDESVPRAYPRLFGDEHEYADLLMRLFPLYEVPMKNSPREQLHTINWRWNLVAVRGTRSMFKNAACPLAQTKVENALAYALSIRKAGLAYERKGERTPVEVRRFYVSDEPPTAAPPRHGDEY